MAIFNREKQHPDISDEEELKEKSKIGITFHKLDWLEWVAIFLCAWLILYPRPYKLVFTLVLILPIIGLILNGLKRPSFASLISINHDSKNNKYDVADFIDFPAVALLLRLLIDFEVDNYSYLFWFCLITIIPIMVLLFATHKLVESDNLNKGIIYWSIIGNVALYTYGATYGINCVYDNSKPIVYEAKVVSKRISHSRRHTSYYIKVEPWGHHYDREEISVSSGQYSRIDSGQTVSIDYKEGVFNIPWYYIE